MKAMRVGDLGFFYHSSTKVPGIAGIVRVVREAYPDFTARDPRQPVLRRACDRSKADLGDGRRRVRTALGDASFRWQNCALIAQPSADDGTAAPGLSALGAASASARMGHRAADRRAAGVALGCRLTARRVRRASHRIGRVPRSVATVTSFAPKDPGWRTRVERGFERAGALAYLDARIEELEPGRCVLSLPFRTELSQQNGYFHAGVTSTLADAAGGCAAATLFDADSDVLSVEFKVNLLAPARGQRLIADARVVRSGRTLTVCAIDVFVETRERAHRLRADAANRDPSRRRPGSALAYATFCVDSACAASSSIFCAQCAGSPCSGRRRT